MDMRRYLRQWHPNPLAEWEKNGKLYMVTHNPEANFPYSIEHAGDDCGGGAPFQTMEQLENYLTRYKLWPPSGEIKKEEQMTLDI